MDHNSSEYRAHQAECLACRWPHFRDATRTQHRPHTLSPDCWCIGDSNVLKVCELDRREWQNLPELEYV